MSARVSTHAPHGPGPGSRSQDIRSQGSGRVSGRTRLRLAQATRCEACGAALRVPYLCEGCGALLREPPGLDHFARFGLAPAIDVDLGALEARHLELSRRLHPDRAVRAGAQTQARALVLTAGLNEAWRVLRDFDLRAEYLLRLHGGPTAEQEKRTAQCFLLRQLELREELEAAQEAGDRPRLQRLLDEVQPEITATRERVRAAFLDPRFPAPELLAQVRLELNALRYWASARAELEKALSG